MCIRDSLGSLRAKFSLFIREPQFQGQTKEKLTNPEAGRLTEISLRDRFDHFLAGDPTNADNLLAFIIDRAEERIRRKELKDTPRKSATRRLRLPGKLADCSTENAEGTEIFLVEGDSACLLYTSISRRNPTPAFLVITKPGGIGHFHPFEEHMIPIRLQQLRQKRAQRLGVRLVMNQ